MHKNRWLVALVGGCLVSWTGIPSAKALHAEDDASLVTSKEKPLAWSIRGSLGALQGDALEQVFEEDYKVSELQWDLSGLAMGGAILSGRYGSRLGVNLGAWSALTKGNGEMKDYDWLVEGMDWSDYSRSDVEVDEGMTFDLNASWLLTTCPEFGVRAVIGYKQDHWKWTDQGREYIYSEFGFRDTEGDFEGINVINYEQTFEIPYAGLNLSGKMGSFLWTAYGLYSPLVSAEDKDHHVLRDLHFEESFSGGDFYALGLTGLYQINSRWFVSATAHYQSIPEFRGDMYIVEDDTKYEDAAGIGNDLLTLSASVGLTF